MNHVWPLPTCCVSTWQYWWLAHFCIMQNSSKFLKHRSLRGGLAHRNKPISSTRNDERKSHFQCLMVNILYNFVKVNHWRTNDKPMVNQWLYIYIYDFYDYIMVNGSSSLIISPKIYSGLLAVLAFSSTVFSTQCASPSRRWKLRCTLWMASRRRVNSFFRRQKQPGVA